MADRAGYHLVKVVPKEHAFPVLRKPPPDVFVFNSSGKLFVAVEVLWKFASTAKVVGCEGGLVGQANVKKILARGERERMLPVLP
jgi:hypothetical protein